MASGHGSNGIMNYARTAPLLAGVILFVSVAAWAEEPGPAQPAPDKNWYEKLTLRGYTQFRYNRLLETNPLLKCEQCDRSWGDQGGFFLRRARLIISGDVSKNVFIYIQPDFATTSGTSLHLGQLRDAYADVSVDADKEFRFRLGQSKVPFGWENLQSSSNRLALDRADSLNSAVPNERDASAFFYWAPSQMRDRFKELTKNNLKGTGDYGIVGFGAYNGQTANRTEANNGLHVATRVTYPIKLPSGQFIEPSLQAYSGRFTLSSADRTTGVRGATTFKESRAAASFVYYPQPLGFQAEWNIGRGPEYRPDNNTIERRSLSGGYVQVMHQVSVSGQSLIPYLRAQYYRGGKKLELDARAHRVREAEAGAEWQLNSSFELTAAYAVARRVTSDGARANYSQYGGLLRLQAQFNY